VNAKALQLEGVTKRFGARAVVSDLSLTVAQGEIVALLGASGSGKTTLLRLISGIQAPDAGRVFVGGRDVTRAAPEARGLGYVFQDYALMPHLSVLENLTLVMGRTPKLEARERALSLLERVGLAGFDAPRPERLSGGQRQRVALARALAVQPNLILLDEPYSALDPVLREGLRAEVARLIRAEGRSALHVTHDPDEAFAVADRLIVLGRGAILDDGAPQAVYDQPRSLESARALGRLNELEVRVSGGVARASGLELPAPGVPDGPAVLAWRWERGVIGAQGLPVTLERAAPVRGASLGVWAHGETRLIAPVPSTAATGVTARLRVLHGTAYPITGG
jgi:iron(III) transport system ATP-binding protein